MIILTIYGDPIPWKRPGLNKRTGAVYDQQAKEKEQCRWQISAQKPQKILTVPVEVNVVFYMKIPESTSKAKRAQMLQGKIHHMVKPDADNLSKHILDCMTGLIYNDDAQIVDLHAHKLYTDAPRTVVHIRPLITDIDRSKDFYDSV